MISENAAEPETRSRDLCCALLQTKHTTDREKGINKSNVWYSSSTVGFCKRWKYVRPISALPQVLGSTVSKEIKLKQFIVILFWMATQFPKGETFAWNCPILNSAQSLLRVVLILYINNKLRQGSVFWAALHSDLRSLTYDVRVHCGKTFQVGQFRQVRSRPLKPSAEFKLWMRWTGEVFWGSTEPTGVSMPLPTPSCAHLPVWAGWQGGVTGLAVIRTRLYLDGPLAAAQGQNITSSWFSLTVLGIAWGNRPQSSMLAGLLFGLQHAPPTP